MSQVLFSIITVVRNNINTIEKAILSVVENKPDFIEYVVIDGQSTDGTLDVINKYKDKIDIFISEKDSGATNAMAKGAKLAKGKYIGYVFADDFYEGDILKNAKIIADHKSPDIISLPCKFIDENNQVLRTFESYDQKSLNIYNALYYPNIGAKLIKKDVFIENNYFWEQDDDGSNFIAADLEFILKCVLNKKSFDILDNSGFYNYLVHQNSTTFGNNRRTILKCYKEHVKIYNRIKTSYKTIDKTDYKVLKKWYLRALSRIICYELIETNIINSLKTLLTLIVNLYKY
ncbi:MAG: hypothetical protein BGO27_00265 [Alphaproteobacteria bacterium 33-17]|nr:MAG: hypothetical protein BGO27_00265 [Alphaproteobacteria bacterium 33-17]